MKMFLFYEQSETNNVEIMIEENSQ